jgi:hypothetical protein
MTTTTKKAQFATYNNCKVGDVIEFLEIPYYKDDLRMYYSKRTITEMKLSKSGKRITVTYDNGFDPTSDIGLNTYFQELSNKFLNEMIEERGWRD